MTVARTASAAAAALCALGLAAAGTAASAPPDLAQALGARDEAMTARYATTDRGSLTIPHDAVDPVGAPRRLLAVLDAGHDHSAARDSA